MFKVVGRCVLVLTVMFGLLIYEYVVSVIKLSTIIQRTKA